MVPLVGQRHPVAGGLRDSSAFLDLCGVIAAQRRVFNPGRDVRGGPQPEIAFADREQVTGLRGDAGYPVGQYHDSDSREPVLDVDCRPPSALRANLQKKF
jgi:hypothetical protein